MPRNDPHYKRNFTLGVLNGTFFMAALAFIAGSTVLPVFLSKLTESKIVIGVISHTEWFGWLFPQVFAAVFLTHRRKVLGFYNRLTILRLTLFASAIASIYVFRNNYTMLLIAFTSFFAVFSLSSGIAGVAFMEVVGKTIPVNSRGSFFGLRMFSGGILAMIGGLAIKKIMSSYPFPYDFAYICIIAWVLMLLGLSIFAFLKEPEHKDPPPKESAGIQLKTALGIIKNDANFKMLIYTRGWVNTAFMATPFYVIFAIDKLGAPDWMAGIYLTVQMVGYLGANLLWGWLSNHVSNRLVIILSTLLKVLPPAIALAGFFVQVGPEMFSAVFFLLGMGESGSEMGFMNYLLEISPEQRRPLYIGLLHTLIAPTILFSGVGGWLSQLFTLKWLFATAFVTVSIALLISLKLREPRIRSV